MSDEAKDISRQPQDDSYALADDIAKTMQLATQACDGHQLSDEELDQLCDALLSSPHLTAGAVARRKRRARQVRSVG